MKTSPPFKTWTHEVVWASGGVKRSRWHRLLVFLRLRSEPVFDIDADSFTIEFYPSYTIEDVSSEDVPVR